MGTLEVMDTEYCNTGIRGCGMWQHCTSESGLTTTGTSDTGSDNTEDVKTTSLDTEWIVGLSQHTPRWLKVWFHWRNIRMTQKSSVVLSDWLMTYQRS